MSARASAAFEAAWAQFSELALWEQFPAELSLRVVRKAGRRSTEHAIALIDRGFALYEDPRAFDAMWSGEHLPMNGLAVIDGVLARILESEALEPRVKDTVLATAAMRLLINLVTGEPPSVSLGRGEKLELRPATGPKRSR